MIPVWTILMLGWITGNDQEITLALLKGNQEFWLLFVAFTGVVGYIYILNQIADIDGDRKNGKLFILPGGHLPIWFAWLTAVLSASVGILVAIIWLDYISVVLLLIGVVLGYLYSFSPWPLKDRPWGGLWGNWLGHGVVTYLVGWYGANYGCSPDHLWVGIASSLAAGFANGAVFLTSTIPDADGDREVGKNTFCVVYGNKKTALLAAIFVTFSVAMIPLITTNQWVMAVPAGLSMLLFWKFVVKNDSSDSFKTFRWPVLILSATVTFFIPIYAVLVFSVVAISHIYYKKRFNLNYPSFTSE